MILRSCWFKYKFTFALIYLFGFAQQLYINVLTVHGSHKTYVVLTTCCTLNTPVFAVLVILSIIRQMFVLSWLCLYLRDTLCHVMNFLLCRGLWVRMAKKACQLAYCKIRPDVVGHPGTSGILHFTYYRLEHAKSFSGILNSRTVWVLEHRGRDLHPVRLLLVSPRRVRPLMFTQLCSA